MSKRMIFMGKVVDDKEEGMYIEDTYFGGMAYSEQEEEEIKKSCIANKSSYYIPKTLYVRNNEPFSSVVLRAKRQFFLLERDMIETEDILKENQQRHKNRAK